MKKTLFALLALLLVLSLAACGTPAASEPMSDKASASSHEVVVFTDEVLEELVRKAMNKPSGDILISEAQAVTELNLEMEGGKPIPRVKDISDLAQFPNLAFLNLNWALHNDGKPVDVSPLAGLKKLERLYICCDDISDIEPLKGLINMKDLWIWGNRNIEDISALSGMTQIESLWIKGNRITDISALANMKNLVYLYMEDNQVTDLSPLAGLSKLTNVLLSGNPATDYSPLKDVYPKLEEKDFELD